MWFYVNIASGGPWVATHTIGIANEARELTAISSHIHVLMKDIEKVASLPVLFLMV